MFDKTRFLMPAKLRFVGIIFFIAGVVAGFVRFYLGIKPKMLNAQVFAVYSEYLDDKFLKTVKNNIGEEITLFFIISGLFLIAFSREKEENEKIREIRYHSLILSFYLSFAFLLAANFLTFGFAFIYMLILFCAIPLTAYIFIFRFHLYLYHRNLKSQNKTGNEELGK